MCRRMTVFGVFWGRQLRGFGEGGWIDHMPYSIYLSIYLSSIYWYLNRVFRGIFKRKPREHTQEKPQEYRFKRWTFFFKKRDGGCAGCCDDFFSSFSQFSSIFSSFLFSFFFGLGGGGGGKREREREREKERKTVPKPTQTLQLTTSTTETSTPYKSATQDMISPQH